MDIAANLMTLLGALLAGIGTSFTPCVYPLIPITLALFGASGGQNSRARSLLLALCYVLGISVTFTTLGVLSAQTGAVFGAFLGSPYVILFLVGLLIIIALFTIDLIRLPFLSNIQQSASTVGGKGFIGAFLMGTASGPVAAPCVGPVLVTYLAIAAEAQSAIWGALLLFSYSIGFGLLFFLIAAFPSLLNRLPRPGNWMNYVKFVIAAGLLLVAWFIARPIVTPFLVQLYGGGTGLVVFTALLMVAGTCAYFGYQQSKLLARTVGVVTLSLAATFFFPLNPGKSDGLGQISWFNSFEEAQQQAVLTGKPMMVDLYADWCAACIELEHKTFPHPAVQTALERFVPTRLDFTDMDATAEAISARYKVLGLPTILFVDPTGAEIPNTRITGFLEPIDFAAHLNKTAP